MRRADSPFEYGEQWIGQEGGRDRWFRYWYDNTSKRVRRKALKSTILEAAKDELIDIVGAIGVSAEHPSVVFVSHVLDHYIDNKYPAAERAGQLVIQALDKIDEITSGPFVSDLTLVNQRKIWSFMQAEGLSSKSISTYCISLRAVINYSAKPQIVPDLEGKETEVRLLTEGVHIECNHAEIAKQLNMPMGGKREYLPRYEELAEWIDAITEEPQFRYVMIALNTWARNSAIFDLNVGKQVDFEFGLIDLNPPGRSQTNKKRPVIRLTHNLRQWFEYWNHDKPIGRSQDRVEKPLNAIGKAIGMPEMTCYVLRHFMASYCRRTEAKPSKDQRSLWMGHSSGGSRTTERYEQFDPDYLEDVMNATDEIILKLDELCKRSLVPSAEASNVVAFKA